MSAEGFSIPRIGRFIKENALLLSLVPIMIVGGTLVHEFAHYVSVKAEGGTVMSVDLFPSRGDFRLGEVRWLPQGDENRPLIAMAPTVVWTTMALGTAGVARWILAPDTSSRIALMIGFFLPIADASLGASGLFCHASASDWSIAFRGHEPVIAVLFALYVTLFGEIGLRLFRRCWGPDVLSPWEYTALYVVALALPWLRQLF